MSPRIFSRRNVFWQTFSCHNIFLVTIALLLAANTMIMLQNKGSRRSYIPLIHYIPDLTRRISCHSVEKHDALASIDYKVFSSSEKLIFFHETSCKGGLSSREACAVESAARANPQWRINVLFAGPVDHFAFNAPTLKKLQEFNNIHILRIHPVKYAKGTPLQSMLAGDLLLQSKWPVQHASDIIRFLTLYKHGGVHLDLDLLVVKSFDDLDKNFAAKEMDDYDYIGSAAIGLAKDEKGRNFSEATIREMLTNFKPHKWEHNGPETVYRILESFCGTNDVTKMSAKLCKGFQVYQKKYFFPINWRNWTRFFKPGVIDLKDTYGIHMWNKLSYKAKVPRGCLYANLAEKFCPSIFELYKDDFGS